VVQNAGISYPNTLKKAVYGLPELYRREIKKARLIANPGCYPYKPLYWPNPALKEGIIDPGEHYPWNSKSGCLHGAGRKADVWCRSAKSTKASKAYGVESPQAYARDRANIVGHEPARRLMGGTLLPHFCVPIGQE